MVLKTRQAFNLWANLWLGGVWLPNCESDTQPYVSRSSCDGFKSRMGLSYRNALLNNSAETYLLANTLIV